MLRKLFISLVLLSVLSAGVAVVFGGMRVHFKELSARFRSSESKTMVDLKLKNGQKIVTSLAGETPSQVLVMIGGVKIPFGRDEISSMEVLSKEQLASGTYGQIAEPLAGEKPWITFREEDRLIDLDKIRKDQERQEKMYRQIGKQRQQQKVTEGILDKYEQHDAEVKRRVKQAEAQARAAAGNP